ncbi:hypothetical protein Mccp14020TZ_04180 [Mycoplasma capricolum subsp. capripneumoniae]|nr:hypothetical protein Mccp14020TZ_04180 [Mycoplasma capricolum subsp. capripneumoniae]
MIIAEAPVAVTFPISFNPAVGEEILIDSSIKSPKRFVPFETKVDEATIATRVTSPFIIPEPNLEICPTLPLDKTEATIGSSSLLVK